MRRWKKHPYVNYAFILAFYCCKIISCSQLVFLLNLFINFTSETKQKKNSDFVLKMTKMNIARDRYML
jgi:hypothetical protein